jgi:hypothetical protein
MSTACDCLIDCRADSAVSFRFSEHATFNGSVLDFAFFGSFGSITDFGPLRSAHHANPWRGNADILLN